jgi:hypothetical protein
VVLGKPLWEASIYSSTMMVLGGREHKLPIVIVNCVEELYCTGKNNISMTLFLVNPKSQGYFNQTYFKLLQTALVFSNLSTSSTRRNNPQEVSSILDSLQGRRAPLYLVSDPKRPSISNRLRIFALFSQCTYPLYPNLSFRPFFSS